MKTLEERLRQARGEMDLYEMAAEFGVSTRTYAGWEAGDAPPKQRRLIELALKGLRLERNGNGFYENGR